MQKNVLFENHAFHFQFYHNDYISISPIMNSDSEFKQITELAQFYENKIRNKEERKKLGKCHALHTRFRRSALGISGNEALSNEIYWSDEEDDRETRRQLAESIDDSLVRSTATDNSRKKGDRKNEYNKDNFQIDIGVIDLINYSLARLSNIYDVDGYWKGGEGLFKTFCMTQRISNKTLEKSTDKDQHVSMIVLG